MNLFEFIKANPDIIETAKNCKTQEELHNLIVKNKIDLNNISELDLYNLIKENHQQDKQIEDKLLKNVAGGMSNAKQRKLYDKMNEKNDPSVRKGNLKDGVPLNEMISNCILYGDEYDKYYKDESTGLFHRLS